MRAYEKLMEEHNLTVSDLPKDAQMGIMEIKKVETGFKNIEKQGRKPTNNSIAKVKAIDKWVVNEILDYLDETNENDEEMPHTADEVIKGSEEPLNETSGDKDQVGDNTPPEVKGGQEAIEIEAELQALFTAGKTKLTSDEVKASAPKAYKHLFEGYVDGDENGVETTRYALLESDTAGTFELTKK